MAGYTKTASDINNKAGSLAVDIRNVMERIRVFKANVMDTMDDTALSNAGVSPADITILRSSFVDLDKLRQIYAGLVTQATTYNFETFAKQLTGTN